MKVYYNENDPKCAQWLRELINAGELPAGDVDERSIEDVAPTELTGYDQCHFFAGIGGWPLALQWAGWDGPVWTGSCPCQPFSTAGKRGGSDDPRALWWAWRWLIDQCRPPTVFGEQVASKDGRIWLAGVRADLEALGYGVGAADLCAAGVSAPHIRQRLWWVADTSHAGLNGTGLRLPAREGPSGQDSVAPTGRSTLGGGLGSQGKSSSWMGNADNTGPQGRRVLPERADKCTAGQAGMADGLSDAEPQRRQRRADAERPNGKSEAERSEGSPDAERDRRNPWSHTKWTPCADGKARRIEPGIEPLADGVPERVGLLRGYGNAIVPQVAAEVILSFVEGVYE